MRRLKSLIDHINAIDDDCLMKICIRSSMRYLSLTMGVSCVQGSLEPWSYERLRALVILLDGCLGIDVFGEISYRIGIKALIVLIGTNQFIEVQLRSLMNN